MPHLEWAKFSVKTAWTNGRTITYPKLDLKLLDEHPNREFYMEFDIELCREADLRTLLAMSSIRRLSARGPDVSARKVSSKPKYSEYTRICSTRTLSQNGCIAQKTNLHLCQQTSRQLY